MAVPLSFRQDKEVSWLLPLCSQEHLEKLWLEINQRIGEANLAEWTFCNKDLGTGGRAKSNCSFCLGYSRYSEI